MKSKRNYIFIGLVVFSILAIFSTKAFAAPSEVNLPSVNISVDGADSAQDYVDNIKLFIFLTILTLLPAIIIMVTSFTRIIVVFSLLKNAIGAQQSIPNQI